MRPTIVLEVTLGIAATAVLALGVTTPAGAVPVPSATAAVRAAAGPSLVNIRCWTGWGWSAAGFAGALRPGILAVGSFYNSMAYGYSGAPQYYGERYPPYYTCDPVYYAYPPPDGYVRVRHRHRPARAYYR
jgi:hypothetical protein